MAKRLYMAQEKLKDAEEEITSLQHHIDTHLHGASDSVTVDGNLIQANTNILQGASTSASTFAAMLEMPSKQEFHPIEMPDFRHEGGLRLYQQDFVPEAVTSMWQILPMNNKAGRVDFDPCLRRFLHLQQCLASGMSPLEVLGPSDLDLSFLMRSNKPIHPFTHWILKYTNAVFMTVENEKRSWWTRIGLIYCIFYLFRWLVDPTEGNFSRIPEFMRPTGPQLCVPHEFWINFVIMPDLRDKFVLQPHIEDQSQWKCLISQLRLNHPKRTVRPLLKRSQSAKSIHLSEECEEVFCQRSNWYIDAGVTPGE